MRRLAIFLVFLIQSFCFGGQLLLKNATVWDSSLSDGMKANVLIENETILDVLDVVPAGFKGEALDLKGKWVIPGLHDLHVHTYGNLSPMGAFHQLGIIGSAQSALYAGVTGVLDLFSEENSILNLRDDQRAGKLGARGPFADLFAAGPIFTSTGGHGTEYGQFTRVINSPRQAELEIRALAYKKPDVIKIVYDHAVPRFTTLTKPTLKRALEVARELGIKSVVHIGTWEDAEEAIDFGANAITHTYSTKIPSRLVEKFKSKGVAFIPTLTVQMDLLNISQNPAVLESPLLKELVPTAFLDSFKKPEKYPFFAKEWLKWQKQGYATFQENVLTLANAGIKVISGTDAANMGTFQGYSLHRELELLVGSGLTNRAALQAATTNACDFLGTECFVRKGNVANLNILSDSPLKDIRNTQKIETVIYRGKIVDRAALRKQIQAAPILEGAH